MALEDEQQLKTIKASQSSSSSSESVPTEIIVEILSRLPVESLLRCKSVCKSWLSLISDPFFIKYHITLSTTNRHHSHHHLLVSSNVPVQTLKTYPLHDVMFDHNPININPLELDYPMKHPRKKVSIVGSCNGLICITIEPHSLFIWNPSTRKSIQLPDIPRPDRNFGYVLHGFGYNESSDDYKVLEIGSNKNIVMLYSSRNGNWKEIGSVPQFMYWNISSVFLKGALHWIVIEDPGSLLMSIVSLDLAKETYSEVLLPVDDIDIDLSLGVLGDCLCALCDYNKHSRFCLDVWVMKDYGVKDSWFKLVSIPYDMESFFPDSLLGDQFGVPLCVSDDGKVLMHLGLRFVVFDSKDDSTLEILPFNECHGACTFVESLVSPGHENLI